MGPPQNGTSNPYNNSGGFGPQSGSRTPFAAGRTPNPYADGGRTPAWNASSRTPNPYDGTKTPAWNASSRTPNPYANDGGKTPVYGGRTPAWTGSKTPNPYGGGGSTWGGATPQAVRGAGWGGATPSTSGSSGGWNANSGWSGAEDMATPARSGTYESTWNAPTPAVAATPGIHPVQTPAYTGAIGRTPANVWGTSTIPATPGDATFPADSRSKDNEDRTCLELSIQLHTQHPLDLDEKWVIDPILSNYLSRIKVVIKGTRPTQYLSGDYENKCGLVLAAQENPDGLEQTARVRLEGGEERSISIKYIRPQEPTNSGEEVLVLGRKRRGRVLVVREQPDFDIVSVSSRQNPADVESVPKSMMVALAPETVR